MILQGRLKTQDENKIKRVFHLWLRAGVKIHLQDLKTASLVLQDKSFFLGGEKSHAGTIAAVLVRCLSSVWSSHSVFHAWIKDSISFSAGDRPCVQGGTTVGLDSSLRKLFMCQSCIFPLCFWKGCYNSITCSRRSGVSVKTGNLLAHCFSSV